MFNFDHWQTYIYDRLAPSYERTCSVAEWLRAFITCVCKLLFCFGSSRITSKVVHSLSMCSFPVNVYRFLHFPSDPPTPAAIRYVTAWAWQTIDIDARLICWCHYWHSTCSFTSGRFILRKTKAGADFISQEHTDKVGIYATGTKRRRRTDTFCGRISLN